MINKISCRSSWKVQNDKKNIKIMIYLKEIIRKFDKYIKDKKKRKYKS